ncbi:MAG: 50S ribosomal protein L15 [Flavobacteriaceae bacterium]|nr:50S ribosomal protein L15 [Flavobacteriaceae bacterium]
MNLSSLKPAHGAVNREGKRVGRGQGSGKGGTAKRGHKGAKSRSGYSKKIGFEGGQMPLQRRVPKFGFKNINRKEYQAVNLSKIQELADAGVTEINLDTLLAHNVVKKQDLVKILGNGELKAKVNVVAHKFSASAAAAIEKAGGEAKTI